MTNHCHKLMVMLATVLIGGCASTTPNKSESQAISMSTMINASAVAQQGFETAYPLKKNSHKTDTRLKLNGLQFGSGQAPMVGACLRRVESARTDACLQFFASEREGKIQPRQLVRANNFDAPTITVLKPRYPFDDSIVVTLKDSDGKIDFLANGELMFTVANVPLPAKLEFSCASAVCNFEFLE